MVKRGESTYRASWLILLGVVACSYLPALDGSFVWDDHHVLTEAALGRLTLHDIFIEPFCGEAGHGLWRPVALASLAFDYRLGGGGPVMFHLTNILCHLLCVSLLYGGLSRLTPGRPWCAWLASLLFGLHPANAETVCWAVARCDLLSCLFTLGYIGLSLRYIRRGGSRWAVLANIVFLLGLGSKENAAVGIVLLALFVIADEVGRFFIPGADVAGLHRRRFTVMLIVALVILGAWAGARFTVLGALGPTQRSTMIGTQSMVERVPTVINVFGRYVRMALWPTDILPVYPSARVPVALGGWSDSSVLSALGLLAAVLGLLVLSIGRADRLVLIGGAWFFIALVPVCHLFVSLKITVAARCLYLPLVGASTALSLALYSFRWRMLRGTLILLLIPCLWWHQELNRVMWRDDVLLWTSAVERLGGRPTLQIAYDLGTALLRAKQAKPALMWLKTAELVDSEYRDIQVNLARAEHELELTSKAIMRLERAWKRHPDNELVAANLGYLYQRTGQVSNAEGVYRSYAHKHESALCRGNLISLLLGDGRRDEAQAIAEGAPISPKPSEETQGQ